MISFDSPPAGGELCEAFSTPPKRDLLERGPLISNADKQKSFTEIPGKNLPEAPPKGKKLEKHPRRPGFRQKAGREHAIITVRQTALR
jgi:hypothetical protein